MKFNCGEEMEEYGRDWCVHGYHVYCEIWWRVYLPFLAQTVRLDCSYGPCFPLV